MSSLKQILDSKNTISREEFTKAIASIGTKPDPLEYNEMGKRLEAIIENCKHNKTSR